MEKLELQKTSQQHSKQKERLPWLKFLHWGPLTALSKCFIKITYNLISFFIIEINIQSIVLTNIIIKTAWKSVISNHIKKN